MTPAGSSHCRRDTFSEGQDVKAGDLLAQIDPRPFQAAYDQAVAKKVQERVCMHSPLEEDGFEPSVPLTRYAGLFRERGSYDDFAPPGSLLTLCLAESGATAL